MRWARLTIILLIALFIGAFFQYTLPGREVVRVTGIEIIRQDFSGWNRIFYAQGDSGNAENINRDLRLINTVRPDGSVLVFRNEDTGFGWPPYFKLDSSDLHAEASNLQSTSAAPQWVAVTHYGWRSRLLTTYPNAVSVRAVSGPDASFFPWFNLIILALIAAALFGLWRLWERFQDKIVDPAVDGTVVRFAKLKDWVRGRR
ncbi:MAG: hypothetical protein ACJAXT_001555 [Paracoccaceae bacterium]|jgi:hypothetical protein